MADQIRLLTASGGPDTGNVVPPIEVRGLHRYYRTDAETIRAVDGVDAEFAVGEFACITGASGSGKSTLLHLLAALSVPDQGNVFIKGRDVSSLTAAQARLLRLSEIGVVFQDHRLIEEMTAVENVALVLEARGLDARSAHGHAEGKLAEVGLEGLGDRFPGQLSGGQCQRVGIARALVGDRTVLLADEPTGALDSSNSRQLFGLLRDLCDRGTTVVTATHEPMCQQFADTTYEMTDGRLARRCPIGVA